MHCPKCGVENPDNARVCNSCNRVLISTSPRATNPDTKTSGLAIVSFVLGILSLLLGIFSGIPAIILGIISLVKISKGAGQLKGKGFAIAGIAIPVVWIPLSLILAFHMRGKALDVKQMTQFAHIDVALVFFNSDLHSYPPSDALDPTGQPYCGSMKLCEAMMGWDLKGFHKDSVFRSDGMNKAGTAKLYSKEHEAYNPNVRIGPFLQPEIVSAYRLNEIFVDVGPFDGNNYVICDMYLKKRHSGKKIGMPVLYYKADTSKKLHDPNTAPTASDSMGNIYNYWDNHALVNLGRPGKTSTHSLANPARFYRNTRNDKITIVRRPYRADSYILISAGYDGEYGTADDICNYQWKYRE